MGTKWRSEETKREAKRWRKSKNWRVFLLLFPLFLFFPPVGTQSREKSMAVRNQWRGHAYICPVNAIQLYSHVSTPDCALFILLNDTRLGRNGVRHPYPYPPRYGHVKFSVPSFIRVKESSTGREIDGKVETESKRDRLRSDQSGNGTFLISISTCWLKYRRRFWRIDGK